MSIHLQGALDHLILLALIALLVGAPIAAYVMGRTDGRDATDEAWREFLADCDCDGTSDDADARRDTQRIRDEVRDRIDTSKSDVHERVLYWLAHEHPDEVREAFDVEERS